jgi:hypothetical protein
MNAFDCYRSVETLMPVLEAQGFAETSQELRDIMAAGSTGTEILMGLRVAVRRFLNKDPALSRDAQEVAAQLLLQIDASLGDAGWNP